MKNNTTVSKNVKELCHKLDEYKKHDLSNAEINQVTNLLDELIEKMEKQLNDAEVVGSQS